MKLTKQIVGCRKREGVTAKRRGGRSVTIVIVPQRFMQPMFRVPIIRPQRGQQGDAVEEEVPGVLAL